MTEAEHRPENSPPGTPPELGSLATPRFAIVDLRGLTPEQVANLPRHAVIPEEWARVIGRFMTPSGESVPAHGPLASHRDLANFFAQFPHQRPSGEATATWNALANERGRQVRTGEGGALATSRPDLASLAAGLFTRLFVSPRPRGAEWIDLDVLRALLLPLPEETGLEGSLLSNMNVQLISTYRLLRLAGFVNQSLGLTGDQALPDRLYPDLRIPD